MSSNNSTDDSEILDESINNDELITRENSLVSVTSISETNDFKRNIHAVMQSTPFKNNRNNQFLKCKEMVMVNELNKIIEEYCAKDEYLQKNEDKNVLLNQSYEAREFTENLNENRYMKLVEQIDDAYMEIKDPHSVFTPPNDPISRFNYIINILQQPVVKELMVKCSEKEEIIQNLQGERGNLLKCTDSLSVIFTSFVSWVIETSNNLKQKFQCYEIDEEDEMELIDPFDKEAIETIVTEYLEIFMNRENGNVSDIDNTLFHRYLLKVKQLIESLANANPNHLGSFQMFKPQWEDSQIIAILQENSDIKNQLENAQKIISTKILPNCVKKVLEDTKESSMREIAKIDNKFKNEKTQIQNLYENMITSYRDDLVKKDEEINIKENEIFTLKNDLKCLEKKYKDLKMNHEENVMDFDRSIENLLEENKKLKRNLKKKNECCDHCIYTRSFQMSNKCVGNSIEIEEQSELNRPFDEEQQIKESLIEKEDTQNYIEILHNLIESQQNTIESFSTTARIQNKLIYHKSNSFINSNAFSSMKNPSENFRLSHQFDSFRNITGRVGAETVANSPSKNSLPSSNNCNSKELRKPFNCPSVSINETDQNSMSNSFRKHYQKPIMKETNKILRFEEFDQTKPSFHDISQCMKFQTSTPNTKPKSKLNLSLKESVISAMSVTGHTKNVSSLLSSDGGL